MRKWYLALVFVLVVLAVVVALRRGSTEVDDAMIGPIPANGAEGQGPRLSPVKVGRRAAASSHPGPGPVPSPVAQEAAPAPSRGRMAAAIAEDRATGASIEGATLARFPTDVRQLTGDYDFEVVDTSASDGRVEVGLRSALRGPGAPSWAGHRHANLFFFASPNHGLSLATLTNQHAAPHPPRRIRLSRSGALRGQVYGPRLDRLSRTAGTAPVVVELKASLVDLFQERESPNWTRDLLWRQELDSAGKFEFEGLPADIGYEVRVDADGEELWKVPDKIRLVPGEERDVDWFLGAGSTIRVTVTEESGGPAVDMEIALDVLRQRGWRYGRGFTEAVRKLRTNASGEAVFAQVPTGNWTVVVCKPSLPEREHPGYAAALTQAPAGTLHEVDVTLNGHGYELEVTLHRGHYIEGQVLDWQGDPVRPSVSARSDHGGFMLGRGFGGERFRIGPLMPGEYEVKARPPSSGTNVAGEPVLARTGDRDVVLQYQQGAVIDVTVVDAATGEPVVASVNYLTEAEGGSYTSEPNQPGPLMMGRIRPGPFSLLAESKDGRMALFHSGGIQPGERGAAHMELGPRSMVDVHYGGAHSSVFVVLERDGLHLGQQRIGALSPAILPVPPGSVELVAWIRDANDEWASVAEQTVTVVAGETLRVDLGGD